MCTISVASLAVTLLSSAIATWLYFKPLTRKRLACQMTSVIYFNKDDYNLPTGATMTFHKSTIERLTKTSVVLWNAGTETLSGTCIVSDDPLRVAFDEGDRILSCRITQRSNDANKASIVADGEAHERRLRYDYLNAKDGFVVELVHDSIKTLPVVLGSIKGVAKGIENLGQTRRSDEPGIGRTVGQVISTVIIAATMAAGLWVTQQQAMARIMSLVYVGFASLVFASAIVISWNRRRRYPTKSLSI